MPVREPQTHPVSPNEDGLTRKGRYRLSWEARAVQGIEQHESKTDAAIRHLLSVPSRAGPTLPD